MSAEIIDLPARPAHARGAAGPAPKSPKHPLSAMKGALRLLDLALPDMRRRTKAERAAYVLVSIAKSDLESGIAAAVDEGTRNLRDHFIAALGPDAKMSEIPGIRRLFNTLDQVLRVLEEAEP